MSLFCPYAVVQFSAPHAQLTISSQLLEIHTSPILQLSVYVTVVVDAVDVHSVVVFVTTREYVPVCGCNSQTYSNKCEAGAWGISEFKVGACSTN